MYGTDSLLFENKVGRIWATARWDTGVGLTKGGVFGNFCGTFFPGNERIHRSGSKNHTFLLLGFPLPIDSVSPSALADYKRQSLEVADDRP